MHPHYHINKGVAWILLAMLSFSLMSVCTKAIGDQATVWTVLFFRFAFSFFALLPWFLIDVKKTLAITNFGNMITRSLLALAAILFLFMALRAIPLTDAVLLSNASPLFIPFTVYFILKEKTPLPVWIGVIIGFIGIAVILKPSGHLLNAGSLYALLSALFASISLVFLRILSKTTPEKQIFFYYFLICTLVGALGSLFSWQNFDLKTLWQLLGVGLFGLFYQLGLTRAVKSAPVRLISSLLFISVPFSGLFDWLIFHHLPTWNTLIGAIIVIAGGCITIFFGRKHLDGRFKKSK